MQDASTLGKIEIVGPDAGEFLNRMYTNAFKKLPVGAARYGLLCKADGMVFDDGVVAAPGTRTATSPRPPPATPRPCSTGSRSGCRPSGRTCGCG